MVVAKIATGAKLDARRRSISREVGSSDRIDWIETTARYAMPPTQMVAEMT